MTANFVQLEVNVRLASKAAREVDKLDLVGIDPVVVDLPKNCEFTVDVSLHRRNLLLTSEFRGNVSESTKKRLALFVRCQSSANLLYELQSVFVHRISDFVLSRLGENGGTGE
jgi:hypothetical protein